MYKVLINFIDSVTRIEYQKGDVFDITGLSEERVHELTSENNRIGIPLIKEETAEEFK
jgi:hypothetical protein|nr:MAG TPA: hypothetical protein [Caudoviricetes sp.]